MHIYKIWYNYIHLFSKYWAETQLWTKFWQIKDQNSVTICEKKMMRNNPNQGLVNINAYTTFAKILPISSQDIERKLNYDGRAEWRITQIQNSSALKNVSFSIKVKYIVQKIQDRRGPPFPQKLWLCFY